MGAFNTALYARSLIRNGNGWQHCRSFVTVPDEYDKEFRTPIWSTVDIVSLRDYGAEQPHWLPMRARTTLLADMLRNGANSPDALERILAMRRTMQRLRDEGDELHELRSYNPIERIKQSRAHVGRLIGIEIEFYPRNTAKIARSAEKCRLSYLGTDGSIGSSGKELRRITWSDSDGRLAGFLSLPIEGTVDRRCGLHVHIDVRHLDGAFRKPGQFGPITTYERLLQLTNHIRRLVPRSRWNNQYCIWYMDNNAPANNCSQSAGYNYNRRYAALNFLSYSEHGTIEFRCQAGSTNKLKIESWALVCQRLVAIAADKQIVFPVSWEQFLELFPEPLRSWCILRDHTLTVADSARGLQRSTTPHAAIARRRIEKDSDYERAASASDATELERGDLQMSGVEY